jgi:hypothetical protein
MPSNLILFYMMLGIFALLAAIWVWSEVWVYSLKTRLGVALLMMAVLGLALLAGRQEHATSSDQHSEVVQLWIEALRAGDLNGLEASLAAYKNAEEDKAEAAIEVAEEAAKNRPEPKETEVPEEPVTAEAEETPAES